MDGNTRICKKCLLREMDEAGFFQNMYDYIARIPADDKTPEEEYERRLSICKECESCCPVCAACADATWRCGQRLHCGTARGKSGSKRETPHSGSCENNGSLCGVLRISEVGKISWDLFASPLRLSDP